MLHKLFYKNDSAVGSSQSTVHSLQSELWTADCGLKAAKCLLTRFVI